METMVSVHLGLEEFKIVRHWKEAVWVQIPRRHGDKHVSKWTDSTLVKFNHEGVLGVGETCTPGKTDLGLYHQITCRVNIYKIKKSRNASSMSLRVKWVGKSLQRRETYLRQVRIWTSIERKVAGAKKFKIRSWAFLRPISPQKKYARSMRDQTWLRRLRWTAYHNTFSG